MTGTGTPPNEPRKTLFERATEAQRIVTSEEMMDCYQFGNVSSLAEDDDIGAAIEECPDTSSTAREGRV